jgi:hypothetical protein
MNRVALALVLGVAGCDAPPRGRSLEPTAAPVVTAAPGAPGASQVEPPPEPPPAPAAPSADAPPLCARMPAARPIDFSVAYRVCSAPPGQGVRCSEIQIASAEVRCEVDGACVRPGGEGLDRLYTEFRRQGFDRMRQGPYGRGPRHGSQRLRVAYGGRRCEVMNAWAKPIEPGDHARFEALTARVLDAVNAPAGPTAL